VLGNPRWALEERFATLESRLANQDDLDALLDRATRDYDGFTLAEELQSRGVPAGVCQTAQDRFEDDPQLAHLGWVVDRRGLVQMIGR
jgi:crotonobetainyl-CoA:carnitine CoA-transferase CaiB-like acyl-CoA transferase